MSAGRKMGQIFRNYRNLRKKALNAKIFISTEKRAEELKKTDIRGKSKASKRLSRRILKAAIREERLKQIKGIAKNFRRGT